MPQALQPWQIWAMLGWFLPAISCSGYGPGDFAIIPIGGSSFFSLRYRGFDNDYVPGGLVVVVIWRSLSFINW